MFVNLVFIISKCNLPQQQLCPQIDNHACLKHRLQQSFRQQNDNTL